MEISATGQENPIPTGPIHEPCVNGNGNGSASGGPRQEGYLANTSMKNVCLRGVKKLIVEMTSIKTLALAAMVTMLFLNRIDALYGVIGVVALTGAKEVDFTAIVNIFQSRFGGGGR
jgi:hypothetical protein